MYFPTTPAFIHTGPWSDHTRAHPAMRWMESYTKNAVDARGWESNVPYSDWHTSDFTLYKADGAVIHGGREAWEEGFPSIYGPFEAHLHEPNFLACWETEEGWEMIGQARVCVDFRVRATEEEKMRDAGGREWDCVTPAAFHFEYVRDGKAKNQGILLRRTHIFADSGPALMRMLKVGQLKTQDLGL
ncbi:MAG: hypothetical protein ALECFALPRED_009011 [Alectoria fallacina]|uniref:Uncharacterized protein n=1 Tax=Alectoria fallacina TaxID=1903189 RepID=A0A8H3J5P3_9LECA|nr:MAG: hypothetical protein ALECFALPRED_009011 [Alectoria fallacina]